MSAEGSEEHSSDGALEILECWHLSYDELSSLVRECLLPLAEQHASLGLAQSLQVEGVAASKAETNPGAQQPSARSASYSSAALQLPSSRPQHCSCITALAKCKDIQCY